jgi:nucleoside-diphosphate-sugar epimerase
MTSVLLFGASGFIGGYVQRALAGDKRIGSVTCPGRDRYDLLGGGVEALTELLREVEPHAVVNCTGRLDGSAYELVQANTAVTAKILDAMAAATPGARLVRLGSASEYGVVPAGVAVSEDHPCRPVSDYGTSHLAGTHLVQRASESSGADGVVLRVFNPIGGGLHEANLLGRAAALIRRAQANDERAITLGPLGAYRDFVDVRDVAAAVVAAVTASSLPTRVFNVASGRAVTAREVVRMLAEVAGFTGEIREHAAGVTRSSAVSWMLGDNSRARDVLGWSPEYDLSASVKALWMASGR